MKLLTFPGATATSPARTLAVSFPTIGQYLDIEALRNTLSSGNYETMTTSQMASAVMALDIVDAIAHFQVLCPALRQELSFASYLDVPMNKAAALTTVYKEQFLPWYWPQLREVLADAKLLAKPAEAAGSPAQPDPNAVPDAEIANTDDLSQYDDLAPKTVANSDGTSTVNL